MTLKRSISVWSAICALALFASTVAAEGNGAVVRAISGEYLNETIAAGERRGGERFELLVHPDGSRTLSISADLTSRNAWFTVVLRADATFRPLEAYASYWNAGVQKGRGLFRVRDDLVIAESSGPRSGLERSETKVPTRFSIGTHPVSADGWHTANHDPQGERTQQLALYSIEAGADPAKPVLGTLLPLSAEFVGEETIEVPAGRFETRRYRLAGVNDLWIYGPDRLVIKSELPVRGLRYVLTSLRTH